jgi:hypothetical protein
MRKRHLRRLLAALLPPGTRRDAFEPAVHDLEAERARAGGGHARLRLFFLFLECWRLAPAEILAMRNRVDDYRLELRRSVVEHPDASGRAAAAIGRMARAVDRIDARLRPRVFPEARMAGPRRTGSPRVPDTELLGG